MGMIEEFHSSDFSSNLLASAAAVCADDVPGLVNSEEMKPAEEAVYPCVLRIKKGFCSNSKDPIVLAVDVVEGIVKVGTPICIPSKDFIDIGRITSIQNNQNTVDFVNRKGGAGGQFVVVEINGDNFEEKQKMFGKDFNEEDELVSRISTKSIISLQAMTNNFRETLPWRDLRLLLKMKSIFKI